MPQTPKREEQRMEAMQSWNDRTLWTEHYRTREKEHDAGRQRHGGFDVVLHVPHFQALQGKYGDQAGDGAENNTDDHQGADGLKQRWKSKSEVHLSQVSGTFYFSSATFHEYLDSAALIWVILFLVCCSNSNPLTRILHVKYKII